MSELNTACEAPAIGILRWEEQGCPMGLRQLELLIGNSTNPDTYSFPIHFQRVPGANIHTVVESPSAQVLQRMIAYAREMSQSGIRAITTSCGFNAIFQKELAESVEIPVFTSSLIQIPLVRLMVGSRQGLAVVTASGSCLTQAHFAAAGVDDLAGIHVVGLEEISSEWNKIFSAPEEEIDIEQVRQDLIHELLNLAEKTPIGAVILECTDLPPFAEAIRQQTGLPVYDFVSLTNYVYQSLGR